MRLKSSALPRPTAPGYLPIGMALPSTGDICTVPLSMPPSPASYVAGVSSCGAAGSARRRCCGSRNLLRRCLLLCSGLRRRLRLLLNDVDGRQLVCGGRRRRCRLLCRLSVGLRRRGLRLLLNDIDWRQLIAGRGCRCRLRCRVRGGGARRRGAARHWSCGGARGRRRAGGVVVGVAALGAVVLGAGAVAPPAGGGEGCVCCAPAGIERRAVTPAARTSRKRLLPSMSPPSARLLFPPLLLSKHHSLDFGYSRYCFSGFFPDLPVTFATTQCCTSKELGNGRCRASSAAAQTLLCIGHKTLRDGNDAHVAQARHTGVNRRGPPHGGEKGLIGCARCRGAAPGRGQISTSP